MNLEEKYSLIPEPSGFALCIGSFHPSPSCRDTFEIYRQYYISKKYTSKKMMVWPDREPQWFVNEDALGIEFDVREASEKFTGDRDIVPYLPDLPAQAVTEELSR